MREKRERERKTKTYALAALATLRKPATLAPTTTVNCKEMLSTTTRRGGQGDKLTGRKSTRVGEFLSSLVTGSEASLHDVLELGVNLLLSPLETGRVLSHLESRNGDTSALIESQNRKINQKLRRGEGEGR